MFPKIEWYRSLEGLGRRPAIDGEDLYVTVFDQYTREYQLKAFKRGDGQLQWVCPLPSGGYASLAVDAERVYSPLAFSQLGAVDRATGTLLWTHDFKSRLRSTPVIWNDRVIVVTANRYVELERTTGRIVREQTFPGKFLFGKVSLTANTAYFLGCNNPDRRGSRLLAMAIDLQDLQPIWETSLGPGRVASSDTAGLAIGDGLIFSGGYDGNVYAIDMQDGSTRWTAPSGGIASRSAPCLADGRLYVGNLSGIVTAYQASSGQLLWRRQLNPEGCWSSPAVVGSSVVSHVGNDFCVLDAVSGNLLSQIAIGHSPYTGISIADDEIYLCGGDPPDHATLFRFSLANGYQRLLTDVEIGLTSSANRDELSASFSLALQAGERVEEISADMRPLGGSQRQIISQGQSGGYAFRKHVPAAKLLGFCAVVVTVQTNQRTCYETLGFDLRCTKPIPKRHVIQNVNIEPQEAVDYSGPAVISGLFSRVGKETPTDEIYRKGNYIVERGLDPHHKWRSGAIRIFHSQSGDFVEATGSAVSVEKLFD